MKTSLLTQPFDSEDISIQFGSVLIDLLKSKNPFYNKAWIISAFAKQSAVQRLMPNIKESVSRGADVKIVLGIDHQGTSIEALQDVLDINVATTIVHNNQPGHTFHPKIYIFEAEGKKAEIFVGSHNLTEGGLFTNYEASTHTTFDFPVDQQEYDTFKYDLNRFLSPPEVIAQPLTAILIENLIARGEIISEIQMREATKRSSVPRSGSSDQPIPKSFFGNERIQVPPPRAESGLSTVLPSGASDSQGNLIWQKVLSASDALRTSSATTNPTGGLRLTQAEWVVNDRPIDQTTYFRNELFGKYAWTIGGRKPKKQQTTVVEFDVYIDGNSLGIYELTISHKPSGEAGQRNYTTMLHWGKLADTIKSYNLVGKVLRLYAPVSDSALFTIKII
jgi:HKD family nuclease